MSEPINITVVIDKDGSECLYCEGVAWKYKGETTIYVVDLIEAAKGRPFFLQHQAINRAHEEWPDSLDEAIKEP